MKRWGAVLVAAVLVVAAAVYWSNASRLASSAAEAAARYEQGEVATAGGRLRVMSQRQVKRGADDVIYRIQWERFGKPFEQLIVVKRISRFAGLMSGWTRVNSGAMPAHSRSH